MKDDVTRGNVDARNYSDSCCLSIGARILRTFGQLRELICHVGHLIFIYLRSLRSRNFDLNKVAWLLNMSQRTNGKI